MATQTYSIQDAKSHLSRVMREVASGTEVVIVKYGKPMARISRIDAPVPKIRFGILKGKGIRGFRRTFARGSAFKI